MKKWLISLTVVCSLLLTVSLTATAADEFTDDSLFTTVHLAYNNGGKEVTYDQERFLLARYADTKEVIADSRYYDGNVFATIPVTQKERAVEVFQAEPVKFSDDDDSYNYWGDELSAWGVVSGDQNGKLNSEAQLTRAQALAMIVRFMGITATEEQAYQYQDVNKDAWYYDELQAALQYKLVADDTKFDPNRLVTRQEFVVMMQRSLKALDWLKPVSDVLREEQLAELADTSSIGAFAKAAYQEMMYNHQLIPYDYEDTGEVDEDGFQAGAMYAHPQQVMTRGETMEQLYHAKNWLPVDPSQAALKFGFDQAMPLIDGSTSTYPFTTNVYYMLFSNGTQHPLYPDKHSKSSIAYQRLIAKEVDMIFASVYPSQAILDEAKAAGVELELIPVAYDAQVFFTNYDNQATGLTIEQISDIYVKNAYSNWNQVGGPNAVMIPYCRNNDSGSHAQMERYFLNGQEINEAIRVENTAMAMSDILTEVIDAQTENPTGYALGYSIFYYYRNMMSYMIGDDPSGAPYLKLLAIDGIYPSDQTIADGSYPLSNNTYVVIRKDEPQDSSARKMAQFMLSDAGQICVQNAGFGPLREVNIP